MTSERKGSAVLSKGVRRALLSSAVLIPATLFAPAVFAQTADAGRSRSIADTDGEPGETVVLNAGGSTGTITSYTWVDGNEQIATGPTPSVRLADGFHSLRLTVSDGEVTSTDFVGVQVLGVGEAALGVDGLTQNRKSTAAVLQDLCTGLFDLSGQGNEGGSLLTPAQEDMFSRCDGIVGGEGTVEKAADIINQLGAEDFSSFRTLSVVFAETQFQTVMDRLLALRAGTRGGVSLAGLNLRNGNRTVDAEQIAASLKPLLGGGASSDGAEPGGLLDDRLGLWMRGNYGEGEKSATAANTGFESDQWGLTAGADYRFGAAAVAGVAIGYGKADVDFSSTGRGGIENKSVSLSAYGTAYLGPIYVDAVVSYLDADYHTSRHIGYEEDFGEIVNQTFVGDTSGKTLSGAVSAGYDFVFGGFTLAPSVGYNYVDVKIDAFTEDQGQVLNPGYAMNLAFGDQDYKSATGNAGVRASYAWKMPWGVLVPHFRGFLVREFEDDIAAFGVRFANDPFTGADGTPPIVVKSDAIDDSYLRLAVGASAQFKGDVSGYFEYQRLEGYEDVDFHDFTVGLRFQHSF